MTVSWIVFLLYAGTALLLGRYAAGKTADGEDFWTAGRKLSPLSVGLSISAGFMSISWSCVYAVQLFYWYGAGALWLVTIPWILALTGIYFLSKKYHGLSSFSQPEMIGERFGKSLKKVVAMALAFVFLVWGGAEIYVAAVLLAPDLKIGVDPVILIISVFIALYTVSGGFRAVVLTDKLQYAIVAVYILIMGFLAFKGIRSAGIDIFTMPAAGVKSGLPWRDIFSPGVALISLTLIAYLPGWLFETDLWLRVQAAKDSGSAKKGVMIAGINSVIFVGILPLFIGISALYLFPRENGAIPAVVGNEGDAIFSALLIKYAPEWVRLFSSLGLVAAAMSTIDTCINVMALSIGYDIAEIRSRRDPKRSSRIFTLISVVLTTAFALFITSLWDIFYLSSGILTTAVALPVASVFFKRAKAKPLLWSSIGGFAGTTLFYFLEKTLFFRNLEPDFLLHSGVGFIFFGIIALPREFLQPRNKCTPVPRKLKQEKSSWLI